MPCNTTTPTPKCLATQPFPPQLPCNTTTPTPKCLATQPLPPPNALQHNHSHPNCLATQPLPPRNALQHNHSHPNCLATQPNHTWNSGTVARQRSSTTGEATLHGPSTTSRLWMPRCKLWVKEDGFETSQPNRPVEQNREERPPVWDCTLITKQQKTPDTSILFLILCTAAEQTTGSSFYFPHDSWLRTAWLRRWPKFPPFQSQMSKWFHVFSCCTLPTTSPDVTLCSWWDAKLQQLTNQPTLQQQSSERWHWSLHGRRRRLFLKVHCSNFHLNTVTSLPQHYLSWYIISKCCKLPGQHQFLSQLLKKQLKKSYAHS